MILNGAVGQRLCSTLLQRPAAPLHSGRRGVGASDFEVMPLATITKLGLY